ncbi:hypothetical protein GCM10025879_19310 [Leuconostoc litchii]|uniref:Uncharacterized protein n=1 Tax=Leuconostoc litchii TaxID=1981069 RepID=A0A6P2CLN7_9LACO|nr:hypothetical protein [Leuconostoc litchii]TYC46796.1 hypothetical protein ESZ47_01250 [Leuconostoc litchii]GMA70685.1 hypothetical protein GCM10025879_19310 [Leuconostoc litchii]
MAFNKKIADIIRKKVERGETGFCLSQFNQVDVANTANTLAEELNLVHTDIYPEVNAVVSVR